VYAIVESGGKQYKMAVGETHRLERLDGNEGDTIEFNKVLLIQGDKSLRVGTPYVEEAAVIGEILDQNRGKKIIIFKKKRRKGYQRTQGHRQSETRVKIQEIKAGS